jgi:queuine tRNA-ribosyltransferase
MNIYPNFNFTVTAQALDSRARTGLLQTPHGTVETPAFIFCATKAAMKGIAPSDMLTANTQIILSNTYHLMLNPGSELVAKAGGLHKFMGWDRPLFTDSGGFQIFSLGHGSVAEEIKGRRSGSRNKSLVKITEEGAFFRSYLNGSKHLLTPEKSIAVQRDLGADLIVVLDECTPFHVDKRYTERSMQLSHRWALRSYDEFVRGNDGKQALYGIVQGGVYPDLRAASTDFVNSQDFFAHAVGGSLGASKEQMYDVVAMTMELLDPKRPVHLLGIGGISDILTGVLHGIDTFDCVHPTRLARHGGALLRPSLHPQPRLGREHINLRNHIFQQDFSPIDPECGCSTCQNFSRSYLHYLLKAHELLALQAITVHNVFTMNRLLQDIRDGIKQQTLTQIRKYWLDIA